jgi:hypothetical protein
MGFISGKQIGISAVSAFLLLSALAGCSNSSNPTSASDYKTDILGGNLTAAQKAHYDELARQAMASEQAGVAARAAADKATAQQQYAKLQAGSVNTSKSN